MDSHIQCEQIHTIPKTELVEFIGIVPNSILSQVKAKIRIQFDMSSDRNTELFTHIKKTLDDLNNKISSDALNELCSSVDKLNKQAEKGFGLPVVENEIMKFLTTLHGNYKDIMTSLTSLKNVDINNTTELDLIPGNTATITKAKPKRRIYSEEDKKFIADNANSIETLMERYNYTTKLSAYKMRAYFKSYLSSDLSKKKESSMNNKNYRRYTDDEKKFIIDESNSLQDLIDLFEFRDLQAASKARAYLKKSFKAQHSASK